MALDMADDPKSPRFNSRQQSDRFRLRDEDGMRTPHGEDREIEIGHNIADAIAWLSQTATDAGFASVGRHLLTIRDRLDSILADKHDVRRH
jgi:hypothetical protein